MTVDTHSHPTWPRYDTLTNAFLVCRCWYSSRVKSAAYGGHLMSKIPRAIRQGIKVISCTEYKYNFLFEREDFNTGSLKDKTITYRCASQRLRPIWI